MNSESLQMIFKNHFIWKFCTVGAAKNIYIYFLHLMFTKLCSWSLLGLIFPIIELWKLRNDFKTKRIILTFFTGPDLSSVQILKNKTKYFCAFNVHQTMFRKLNGVNLPNYWTLKAYKWSLRIISFGNFVLSVRRKIYIYIFCI